MHSPGEDASKLLPTTLEDCVSIFQTPFELRTDAENDAVVSVLEQNPHFNHLIQKSEKPQERLLRFSKLFNYEILAKGQALAHYEDSPYRFWMIVKGEVRKYIKKTAEEIAEEKLKAEKLRILDELKDCPTPVTHDSCADLSPAKKFGNLSPIAKHGRKPLLKLPSFDRRPAELIHRGSIFTFQLPHLPGGDEEVFKKFNLPRRYFVDDEIFAFRHERTFTSGDTLASLTTNFRESYTSTLVAWSEVHLVSIQMKDYNAEVKLRNPSLQEKMDFLFKMFPELSERVLLRLSFMIQKRVLRLGDTLYTEGSDCTELYMIQKGEVELSKKTTPNGELGSSKVKNVGRNHKAPLLIVSEAQLVGEEMILDYERRLFSAKAKASETVLYTLTKPMLTNPDKAMSLVLSTLIQKGKTMLNSKLARLESNQSEAKVAQGIFEEPTVQEKNVKESVKNAVDHYARKIIHESISKGEGTFISSGVQGELQISPEKLQRLGSMKALTYKTVTTKAEPRIEIEKTTAAVFDAIAMVGSPKAIIPTSVLSNNLSREFPTFPDVVKPEKYSVWNEAMKGTWLDKKVKGRQSPVISLGGGVGLSANRSLNRMRSRLTPAELMFEKSVGNESGLRVLENSQGSVELEEPALKNFLVTYKAPKNKIQEHVRSESVDRMIQRDINEMLFMKRKDEGKNVGFKGKLSRIKKGLESPKKQKITRMQPDNILRVDNQSWGIEARRGNKDEESAIRELLENSMTEFNKSKYEKVFAEEESDPFIEQKSGREGHIKRGGVVNVGMLLNKAESKRKLIYGEKLSKFNNRDRQTSKEKREGSVEDVSAKNGQSMLEEDKKISLPIIQPKTPKVSVIKLHTPKMRKKTLKELAIPDLSDREVLTGFT